MTSGLEEAMAVYLEWLERRPQESPETLLEEHAALDAYLRPMVYREDDAAAAAPAKAAKAQTFGDYRLVRELGRGGMGVVYEARQASLGRSVALKILTPHLTHDPATLVRFRREASTAARLEHPGIAQVLEFGKVGEQHFLAMQLVRGTSLESILRDLHGRPLSEANGTSIRRSIEQHQTHAGTESTADTDATEAAVTWTDSYIQTVVRIVIQVAETLDYAHNEGVIHRDVKPSNILVQPNGRAVLVDFGLAREEGPSSLTLTGDFAGSPYYVSPEQGSRQSSELDRRTDIFSLGVTLYEALTLQRPFEGASSHEIIAKILHDEPVDPVRFHSALPQDLAAIVLKALEKPLHLRYQSAAEFARDLHNFLALRPVTARHPTRVMRIGRWMRREPVKAMLAATVLIALVLLGYLLASHGERVAGERELFRQRVDRALALGWFATMHGDKAAVQRRFLDVLAIDPGNARALFGYLYIARLSTQTSLAFVAKHHVPGRDEAALAEIRRYYAAEKSDSAAPLDPLPRFIRTMFRYPRIGGTHSEKEFESCLGMLESVIYNARSPRFEHYMQAAFLASQIGDRKRARLCADALEAHWPDFAPALVSRGVALRFTEPKAAIAAYRRAIELDPGLYAAHFNLALALSFDKQLDAAIAAARQAIAAGPKKADAYSITSLFLTRKAGSDPTNRDALMAEAVELARHSVEIDATLSDPPGVSRIQLLMQLAVTLDRTGKDDEAIECVQKILARAPQYGRAHRSLIGMMRKTRNRDGERQERERWAKVHADGPTAQRELAEFLLQYGEGEADAATAVAAARRARQLTKGDDAFVYVALAEALARTGKREEIPGLLAEAESTEVANERERTAIAERIAALRAK